MRAQGPNAQWIYVTIISNIMIINHENEYHYDTFFEMKILTDLMLNQTRDTFKYPKVTRPPYRLSYYQLVEKKLSGF